MKWWIKFILIATGMLWMFVGLCTLIAAGEFGDFLAPVSTLITSAGLIFLGNTMKTAISDKSWEGKQKVFLALAATLLISGALLLLFRTGWIAYQDIYDF